MFACLLILGITCLAVPVSAEETPAGLPGRATLDLFLNEITNYSAQFKQTLYDEYGSALEQSSGIVTLLKPGKFRWEYVQPYRQKIVSNGQFLWIFDEDLEQVTINKVDADGANSPLALLVNGAQIDSTYQVEAVSRDDDLQWLALLPRGEGSQYQRVEIGVNETDVVQMRLHDNLNQLTVVEFIEADKQAELDPESFEFRIPAGVDVINGLTE